MDEHRHYLLTPRDLTAWVRGLLRYELNSEQVLDCVAYEVRKLVRTVALSELRIWREAHSMEISIRWTTRPSMPPNTLSPSSPRQIVHARVLRFVSESAPSPCKRLVTLGFSQCHALS